MKQLMAVFALALVMVTTSMDAEAARRFGGGSSLGRPAAPLMNKSTPQQAPQMNQTRPTQQQNAAPNRQGAQPAANPPSPWRGMLMGAAAALGLTALMSALGLGEGFAGILLVMLVAAVLFMAFRFFMVRKMATSGMGVGGSNQPRSNPLQDLNNRFESQPSANTQTQTNSQVPPASFSDTVPERGDSVLAQFSKVQTLPALTLPAGFDRAAFERVAMENFVALQKAWDSGNVLEISEFLTDELFTEITHKLRERGSDAQQTLVDNVKVSLLGLTQQEDLELAVLHFEGTLKVNQEVEDVNELWVLQRPKDGSTGWLLAGIEVQPGA